ncbi:MAG: beta-lactamase family protein [Gemmatimonadetes bacterium]|nr:beta-lactamase family protein [Gemmatimonadota bacterium]
MMRIDSIVEASILDGATPGAALAIGNSRGEVHIRTYGRTDWAKSAPAVTDSTLFDLASLTKVMATTPAAMLLVQEGKLDLDAEVWRYLPYWPRTGAKGKITIRELLTHTSGLPAGADLERVRGDREARIRWIATRALEAPPGRATIYSDLGMIVLGAVVERITGERLDRFATERLFRPLEMRDTRFTPLAPVDGSPFDVSRIAATERTSNGLLQGTVQDPTARALGGVAGNAGLFSSVRDVARYAELMLRAVYGEDTPVLTSEVVKEFATRQPGAERALGWDVASPKGWGKYFTAASFGHTGYTGTSIWIDPAQDVFVVLLTNRVDPTAANQKHQALRRALNEEVRASFAMRPGAVEAAGTRGPPGPVLASVAPPDLIAEGDDAAHRIPLGGLVFLLALLGVNGSVLAARAERPRRRLRRPLERRATAPPAPGSRASGRA